MENRIFDYARFVANEALGINLDVLKIAKDVHQSILGGKDTIRLDPPFYGATQIKVVKTLDARSLANFNITRSSENSIQIAVKPGVSPDIHTLEHELNHALQFLTMGKKRFLKRVSGLEASSVVRSTILKGR